METFFLAVFWYLFVGVTWLAIGFLPRVGWIWAPQETTVVNKMIIVAIFSLVWPLIMLRMMRAMIRRERFFKPFWKES